jgi:hypothetical protein
MFAIPRGYVLSTTAAEPPVGHSVRSLDGYSLVSGPGIPVHSLTAPSGAEIGWLLGWPVAAGAQLVSGTYCIEPDDPEPALYVLGGAWLAVLPKVRRVYLDPAGTLGLVYSKALQRATPTSAWMPEVPLDDDLVAALDIPAKFLNWYPFGVTPRRGVTRLLPNHYLDLHTWDSVRHWPNGRLPSTKPQEAIEVVGTRTEETIRAIAPLRPYMSLTAGRDTRMLLACARALADQIEYFTIAIPNRQGALDVDVASRIARRVRLNHTVLDPLPASDADLDEWQRLVDRTIAGYTWRNVRLHRTLDASRPYLPGEVGASAIAMYWVKSDTDSTELNAAGLCARLGFAPIPALLEASAAWLALLPDVGTFQRLDLLFGEMRTGCWAAAANVGHAESSPRIYPLAHRESIAAMMGLPADYKRRKVFGPDLIRTRWPELAELPFNRPPGVRGLVAAARGFLRTLLGR